MSSQTAGIINLGWIFLERVGGKGGIESPTSFRLKVGERYAEGRKFRGTVFGASTRMVSYFCECSCMVSVFRRILRVIFWEYLSVSIEPKIYYPLGFQF